jgi:aspartyl/asparaginyl beta-hydroxylase (cupin superfamily)
LGLDVPPPTRGSHIAHDPRTAEPGHDGWFDPSATMRTGSSTEADPCRLMVDGQAYRWRNGEHVLFDDTYTHDVRNLSDRPRVVLFCDVERPMKTASAQRFNKWVCTTFGPLSNKANDQTERRATTKPRQAVGL